MGLSTFCVTLVSHKADARLLHQCPGEPGGERWLRGSGKVDEVAMDYCNSTAQDSPLVSIETNLNTRVIRSSSATAPLRQGLRVSV